ncbi:MAG: thioredoxin domain-containing protein [Candidatus Omnitrophica bacterium]|nr:thioredoxin domain-containing protein [Candidatus Omnitrophota bacterium]
MSRWLMAVLTTAAIVFAGIGFLFSIRVMVEKAIAPVGGTLREIASIQKEIRKKVNDSSSTDLKSILARLDALERRVKVMEESGDDEPKAERKPPQRDLSTVHQIPVGKSAVFGKADAPVTIVVFNDFECPFCGRFYPAALEAAKAYPDKVKLVVKHFPLSFHQAARPAAKAALAAGVQGKFYEMTDLLFQNTKELTEDKFKALAGQLKLNVAQFMKDYKGRDDEWEERIDEDMELAQKVGVQGTPSYYLNGRAVRPGSPDDWKTMISGILNAKPVAKPADKPENPVKK